MADKLRAEAFYTRMRQNDLVRRYVRLGRSVLAGANAARP